MDHDAPKNYTQITNTLDKQNSPNPGCWAAIIYTVLGLLIFSTVSILFESALVLILRITGASSFAISTGGIAFIPLIFIVSLVTTIYIIKRMFPKKDN